MSLERDAQLNIRNLKRYKEKNGTHAELVTDELLLKLDKFVDEENFPPGPEEKGDNYPIEWTASKKGVTTALKRFETYAASKIPTISSEGEEKERKKKRKAGEEEAEEEERRKKEEEERRKKEEEERKKEEEKRKKEEVEVKREGEKDKAKENEVKGEEPKIKEEDGADKAAKVVTLVDPAFWPNFSRIVGEEISLPAWKALENECKYSGCDFIDVYFRLEMHCQGDDGKTTPADLLRFAYNWLQTCPEAMQDMEEHFYGNQDLKKTFDDYRKSHPRRALRHASPGLRSRWGSPGLPFRTRDQSVFSENPQKDREEVGFAGKKATPGWDCIILSHDPDIPGNDSPSVEGTIHLIIWKYLDVCLPSLGDPDKERHVLIPCADYEAETNRFSATDEGKKRIFRKSADRKTLNGCEREDIQLLYYVSAVQVSEDTYPPTYAVGFKLIQKRDGIMPWSRCIFSGKFNKGGMIDAEVNKLREEAGQEPITITPKYIG